MVIFKKLIWNKDTVLSMNIDSEIFLFVKRE